MRRYSKRSEFIRSLIIMILAMLMVVVAVFLSHMRGDVSILAVCLVALGSILLLMDVHEYE